MQAVWHDTLSAVNMASVWERKRHFEELREHERRAATAFGVDSVFTTSHLSLSGAYIQFLRVRRLLLPSSMTKQGLKPCWYRSFPTSCTHLHLPVPQF